MTAFQALFSQCPVSLCEHGPQPCLGIVLRSHTIPARFSTCWGVCSPQSTKPFRNIALNPPASGMQLWQGVWN